MQNHSYDQNIESEEVSLKDYLNITLRYKWQIIVIFLLSGALGVFYLAKAHKIYQATSTILIEDKMSNDVLFKMPSTTKSSINNNIEIIKSNPVLQITYGILKKNKDFKSLPISQLNEKVAIYYLKGSISVESKINTDILTISATSESPLETKLIADAIAEALKKQNTNYARLEFTSVREFLGSQLEEAEMRLRSSEEELRLFKIENGISILDEETKKLIEASSDLSSMLSASETDLTVASDHLKFLKKQLTRQDSMLINVNSVLTTPTLNNLIQTIIKKQDKYLAYLSQPGYTVEHPQLEMMKKENDVSKNKLQQELKKNSHF